MELSEFSKIDVLEFYKTLPFNIHGDSEKSVAAIKSKNSVENYPCLAPLLSPDCRVLEIGCGAGWLSNCMAHYYQSDVTGIDFNPKVIEYAQKISAALDVNAQFLHSDLFLYSPSSPYDVVASLGVLHHTGDCNGAIKKICTEFVKPGGYFFLGLYHHHGRKPFLQHFEVLRANGSSEEELLLEYKRLHSNLSDDTHLLSWFRDQVLHPHETQHTLEEVHAVMKAVDVEIVSTSINGFKEIEDIRPLFQQEKGLEEISRTRLESGSYFPGFFVVLGRRAKNV